MRHRIRGAAVVVHEGRLLLAGHERHAGVTLWTPPGGGAEGEEGVLAAAAREAEEETNIRVVPDRPIYAQEFVDRARRSFTLELFVLCSLADGAFPDDVGPANEITAARWVDRHEAAGLRVLPIVFATTFWDDLTAGFPAFRHLGLTVIGAD